MSNDSEWSQEELDRDEELAIAMDGEFCAAGYISLLVKAVERGDASIGIPLDAWENAMGVVERALPKHVAGRLQGPGTVTLEDIKRMQRLRVMGASVIAGGEDEPELPALAERCLETLLGPQWKTYQRRAEIYACSLLQSFPPG